MSAIQEETEDISPAITILRKPRFSKHFSRRSDNKIVSTPGRFDTTSDYGNGNNKGNLSEQEVESRRSSDSSLSSSSFKVLPPIQSVDSTTSTNNTKDNIDSDSSPEKDKDKVEKVTEPEENLKVNAKDGEYDLDQIEAESLSSKISRMKDSNK